jgi:hypothetical protein
MIESAQETTAVAVDEVDEEPLAAEEPAVTEPATEGTRTMSRGRGRRGGRSSRRRQHTETTPAETTESMSGIGPIDLSGPDEAMPGGAGSLGDGGMESAEGREEMHAAPESPPRRSPARSGDYSGGGRSSSRDDVPVESSSLEDEFTTVGTADAGPSGGAEILDFVSDKEAPDGAGAAARSTRTSRSARRPARSARRRR